MADQRKGAMVTMVVLTALLAGIGVWQFGGLGLGGGEEHESESEYEYEERYIQRGGSNMPPSDTSKMLERIAAEENGRIVEVEHERERGRDLYEIKLVAPDGRVHELKIDAESGEVIDRD